MARARVCSECSSSLEGKAPQAKTCSPACRTRRSQRLRASAQRRGEERALPEHQREISQIVRGEKDDVLDRVIQEELRPVVREAITEETLRAIGELVGLAPRVVQKLQEDLESEDSTVRQKAYTLIVKYTLGHPAIVRPPDEVTDKQLVVNFEMPRPETVEAEEVVEEAAVELDQADMRQCDMCDDMKPITEFVAGSHRCASCYESQRARAKELADAG